MSILGVNYVGILTTPDFRSERWKYRNKSRDSGFRQN